MSAAEANAVSTLRGAEVGAVSAGQSGGFYTGSGGTQNGDKTTTKFSTRKKGIATAIIALLLGAGGLSFLGSSNSILAPAIEALFTEATDTQYASGSTRSLTLIKHALKDTSAVSTTKFGKKYYSAMSGGFKKRLRAQGIEVKGFGTHRVLTYKGEDITADDFVARYRSDAEFRDSYTQAKRGRVASFFDKIADKIYSHLGISRNQFRDYKQTGDSDVDAGKMNDTLSDNFENNTTHVTAEKTKSETEVEYEKNPDGSIKRDADGNPIVKESKTKTEVDGDTKKSTSGKSDATDVETGKSNARDLLKNVAETVGQVGQLLCTIMQVGTMISAIVAANEIYQSIQYFLGFTENISKMKAGYGDSSATNEFLNFLSRETTTKINDLSKVQEGSIHVTGDDTATADYSGEDPFTDTVTGSPLMSNGMQMVLGGATADTSTSKAYSIERTGNAVMRALSIGTAMFTTCNAVRATNAVVSIVVTIGTLGAASIASTLIKIGASLAVSVAVTAVLSFLIPTIAQSLFTNIFETATGIPAGELFAKGASASNTRLGRTGSGQSLSSKSVALAYNRVNNEVLALDAELDRKNRSPFDYTNKNTFLGTIAYALLPTTTSSDATSSATALVRSTSKSLASLLPGVYADGEGSSYMTTFGNCPNLKSIGAVGDIYCNPITSTDTGTLNLAPTNEYYNNLIDSQLEGCDDDGNNCKPKKNSNLDRYINYCDNRDSPFGVTDQNIVNELEPTSSLGNVLSQLLSVIPIIGDLLDVINAVADQANEEWATGAKCVNSDQNSSFWNSDGKYYQRYVEDMRLLEQMGAFEADSETGQVESENPVTAAIARYEAEHPINTYEEYLSRISGLTVENVETVLAFVEYYQYINDYNPDSRIAFREDGVYPESGAVALARIESRDTRIRFNQEGIIEPGEPVLATREYIIYADVRNRNYTV